MDVLDDLFPFGEQASLASEVTLEGDLGIAPVPSQQGGRSQAFGLTSGGLWVARVGVFEASSLAEVPHAAGDESNPYYPAHVIARSIPHHGPVVRLRNLSAQPEAEGHGGRLLEKLRERFPAGTLLVALAEPLDKTLKDDSPELKAAVTRLKRFYAKHGFQPLKDLMFVYTRT